MGVKLFAPRQAAATSPSGEADASGRALTRPFGRYGEATALLLFTSSAFLLLALLSARVDPNDPTVSDRNWVGPAGGYQDAAEGTDFHAVQNGYVSVTPLQIDLTRHAAIPAVQNWLEDLNG